jgi:gas vesicle protein
MIASGSPRESGGTPGASRTTYRPSAPGTPDQPKDDNVTQITNRSASNAISKPAPTSTVPSMSYAGPASRNRGSSQSPGTSQPGSTRQIGTSEGLESPSRPGYTAPDDDQGQHETDWQQLAIFGAGLALGLALGAGAALLAAPQTGEETRAAIRGRVRRIKRTTGRRSRDAWAELGDELRGAARTLRRRRAKRQLQRELDRESSRGLVGN